MSAKNTDRQGRLRSKTVAFRMSPEEAELLQRMADASGITLGRHAVQWPGTPNGFGRPCTNTPSFYGRKQNPYR